MSDDEKVKAAIEQLLGRAVTCTVATRLKEDLALDSANLIELTVVMHGLYGVDLGRRAAERKVIAVTVGDVAGLLRSA